MLIYQIIFSLLCILSVVVFVMMKPTALKVIAWFAVTFILLTTYLVMSTSHIIKTGGV